LIDSFATKATVDPGPVARSYLPPDNFFPSPPRLTSAIDSPLHRSAGSSSAGHDNSRELLHSSLAPFNLLRSCVRRASGFLLTDVIWKIGRLETATRK
jgi:hypothetical protein